MGFYGNITNTNRTTFEFDKIYPNRRLMDAEASKDNIFIGRYVLVEYQNDAAYPVVYIENNKFYSSPNHEEITRIKFLTGTRTDDIDTNNDGYYDGVYKGEIVQHYVNLNQSNGNITFDKIEYYICTGAESNYAKFNIITPENQSDYITNFKIDEQHYSNEKGFKGYDSTVWVKASIETDGKLITKYVHIADLNSVVPTFDIAADAPTMEPLTPHFDADSTNVYYKLHMQTPYGFRIKEIEGEGASDEVTNHYITIYDKDTNTTKTESKEVDADIFYNKDALIYNQGDTSNRVTSLKGIDEIKIVPSGKSKDFDTKYSHKSEGENIGDIQELSIHLPSIGYMVSQGWDVIHGPERDDSTSNSLQGRLDFFTQEIESNEIPVQSEGGYLVGSTINGNQSYTATTGSILTDELLNSENKVDDAWIETNINIQDNNEYRQNGITIHHKFTEANDTKSQSNLNDTEVSTSTESKSNLQKDDFKPIHTANTIDLYTPKVDAAGHVVGKNIETVTLPYGYKKIIFNNSTAVSAAPAQADRVNHIADTTQDKLIFNATNKWITFGTGDGNNVFTYGHLLSPLSKKEHASEDIKIAGFGDSFNILKFTTDEAGHITAVGQDTITIPKGGYDAAKTEEVAATNIITEIGFVPTSGKITSKYATTNSLQLQNYSTTNKGTDDVESGDTINTAFAKLQNQINALDYIDSESTTTKFVSKITQSDGQIEVTHSNAGTLQLFDYSQGTSTEDINSNDTINSAFAKLQNQIIAEEKARANAINGLDVSQEGSNATYIAYISETDGKIKATSKTLVTTLNNTAIAPTSAAVKTYVDGKINALLGDNATDTLNSFTEIADWINTHGTEASNMAAAITVNTESIKTEKERAESAEAALSGRIKIVEDNYATATELSNYVSKNDYNELLARIGALEERLTALESAAE